ncbi:MAG: amino acid ABC transporter permease [Anaerolineae bacterium]|nr:amino acid ABC transporter permease [Anaerolineae bacterium]
MDERARQALDLPPLPDNDNEGITPVGPYERFIGWAAGLPWWAIILGIVVVVVGYSMLTSEAYRRVIRQLTDNPQVSTDDLFFAVLLVGDKETTTGMLARADSVETVIQQLIEEVDPAEADDFGILVSETQTEITLRTDDGRTITIPKRDIVDEKRTETPDAIQVEVTYFVDTEIVTGTVTDRAGDTLTIRTVDEVSETFAVSRVLSRDEQGELVTIQREGEIITGTLDTLNNTSIKIRVPGADELREIRRNEIVELNLPTLTLAVHDPGQERPVNPGEEVRVAYINGADLTNVLKELNRLDTVDVPLFSVPGEAQVALVGYDSLDDALEATSQGEVDALLYLDDGPERLAVDEWVTAHPDANMSVVLLRECETGCQVMLKLEDDAITGRIAAEDAEAITVVTTEAVTIEVDKDRILEERRMEPGTCALNNLRGCNAGIFLTLTVTFRAYALALIIGLMFGILRVQTNPVLYAVSTLYVEVIRGIPLLVILLYAGFVISPELRDGLMIFDLQWLGDSMPDVVIRLPKINLNDEWEAVLGLSFGYGAFIAEIFRAGIQSIGRGQMEAARSLGMSYPQAMRHVVLPQAIRVVLPPLGNDFIAMLKDSALISVLALPDLLQLGRLYVSRTFRALEGYNTVAVLYLVMTIFLSMMVRIIERRARLPQ